MRNVYVISGVAGMSGSELTRQLTKTKYNGEADFVIGFDNFFASSKDNICDLLDLDNFSFFEYDLTNEDHMLELEKIIFEQIKPPADDLHGWNDKLIFINCAAVVHTEHFYDINSTFDTNVIGMKNFLELAIKFNANTYINCSTSEVYSMQSWADGGVKETDFLTMSTAEHSQRTSYAAGKLLTEFFMKDAVDKGLIKGCSIRFANVYSNDEFLPKHIIPHIITSIEKGNNIELLESAKYTKRTFLHNYDSCSAIIALCGTESALDGTVYNVGTLEEYNIVNLAYIIAARMGCYKLNISFKGMRSSDPERRLLDISKIQKATGWTPKITLLKGIDMILKHRKSNEKKSNCNSGREGVQIQCGSCFTNIEMPL